MYYQKKKRKYLLTVIYDFFRVCYLFSTKEPIYVFSSEIIVKFFLYLMVFICKIFIDFHGDVPHDPPFYLKF